MRKASDESRTEAEQGWYEMDMAERESEILMLRSGLYGGKPLTLEEVGEHFNVTREHIRQMEARMLSKWIHPSSFEH